MNNGLCELFSTVLYSTHGDSCATTMSVYAGETQIEFDWFDHLIKLVAIDDNKVRVEYWSRPNLKVEYSRFDEWEIESVNACMYNDNIMFVMFKYRNLLYRLVYDFNESNFIVQLILTRDDDMVAVDFDDDYTDDFMIIVKNVVDKYESNLTV